MFTARAMTRATSASEINDCNAIVDFAALVSGMASVRRFAEFQNLEGAFGRRALIERAKGILMERHSTNENQAFEMLRTHTRTSNRKLIDIAAAVVDDHTLLPATPESPR